MRGSLAFETPFAKFPSGPPPPGPPISRRIPGLCGISSHFATPLGTSRPIRRDRRTSRNFATALETRDDFVLTGPESLSQAAQIHTIGDVIGRPLRLEELSPDEFRRDTAGTWPGGVAEMLLAAWRATLGRPAFVTSVVHEVLGAPPRTFYQWAADHAAAFAGVGSASTHPRHRTGPEVPWTLCRTSSMPIRRHAKVRATAYDPAYDDYFRQRSRVDTIGL